MKKVVFGLLAIISCTAWPAAHAQTGRIAHFSHGGSVAALGREAAPADNMGEPRETRIEKITRLNDTMALLEGKHNKWNGPWQPLKWHHQYYSAKDTATWQQAVKKLRQQYPAARFVGFDKQQSRRGNASKPVGQWLWGPTKQASGGALVILATAAVGWLLARKRPV